MRLASHVRGRVQGDPRPRTARRRRVRGRVSPRLSASVRELGLAGASIPSSATAARRRSRAGLAGPRPCSRARVRVPHPAADLASQAVGPAWCARVRVRACVRARARVRVWLTLHLGVGVYVVEEQQAAVPVVRQVPARPHFDSF